MEFKNNKTNNSYLSAKDKFKKEKEKEKTKAKEKTAGDNKAKIKKTILIDLDGVLNEYGNKPYNEKRIPDIKIGAKTFLKKLNRNYNIIIFTSRNLLLTSKWIIKNNLQKYIKEITNIKLPAYLYIDDRTICFKGNYNQTADEISNFKVHWQKGNEKGEKKGRKEEKEKNY